MTFDAAPLTDPAALVAAVTYQPGWELTVYATPAQGLWLLVHVETADAYNPGAEVVLDIRSPIPPHETPADFYRWLRWRLEGVAVHEVHEWLRWADTGLPLWDPHAPEAVLPG